MKNLISTFLIFLITLTSSIAQTRRMDNAAQGRTFGSENQNRTVLPLLQKAQRQFRLFDYDGTFLTLESAIAQNPYSFEALLSRAKFRQLVGMQTEADADILLANRINPFAANLYGYYGNVGLLKILSVEPQLALKNLSSIQKINYYYEALDAETISNELNEAEWNLLDSAITSIEADYLEEAMKTLEETIIQFPQSAIAYDLKGLVFKKQGDYEKALQSFSTAVSIKPDFAIAWYNLGRVEKALGHMAQAKTYFDKAIELQQTLTKAYFERALVSKQMGDTQSAIDDYDAIIKMKNKAYMEAYLNRGLTKKMLGDYNGALSDLNQAIKEYPKDAKLFKNRGNLNLLFGLTHQAIDDYTKAIHLDENYVEAYYNRALAHFLLYDNISGCFDLEKSAAMGYDPAIEMQTYFCN